MIDFNLYLITDRTLFRDTVALYEAVEEALKGGVKALQLREKDLPIKDLLDLAYRFRELTARYGARLFVNDRVDVAAAVEADGVHVGQSGLPPSAAKKVSGRLIIGVSTHSLEEALEAQRDGTDFITFGPVYSTPSKLKYGPPVGTASLKKVCSEIPLPVFGIGGIREDRIGEVKDSGAHGIAMISAILGSGAIKETSERILRYLS